MNAIEIVVYLCAAFVIIEVVYIGSIIAFSRSDLNTFYVTLPVNRFAFVTKGGEVTKIIYNSKDMKLVADPKCPLGKFVPLKDKDGNDTPGPELHGTPSTIENFLGVRYVGIPFIHSLLEKKMSWISVEGGKFIERKDQSIWNFAITKTFGFYLKELVLGRDSDKDTPGKKPVGDDNKLERILVNIEVMMQGVVECPHLALIATNWMAGVEAKLTRVVQGFLGHTSQDELIEQRKPKKNADGKKTSEYCDLVQEIIDNLPEIQVYGVSFDPKMITYVDYKLAGGEENVKKIQAANTKLFEKKQEAAGIKETKAADQEDMRTQKVIMIETIRELTAQGLSLEQAERIALSMMRTKGLAETGLGTLVEGGANVSANISTGPGKGTKKKGG